MNRRQANAKKEVTRLLFHVASILEEKEYQNWYQSIPLDVTTRWDSWRDYVKKEYTKLISGQVKK